MKFSLSKELIVNLLIQTNRKGMDKLINYMEDNGFFTAPCSASHHLAIEGGLAEHSYNVWDFGERMREFKEFSSISRESYIIVALLHDLGKIGQFGKENYIPNILKSGKISDSKPYVTNSNLLKTPHEVRSIQIASKFIDLTEEESFAILCHDGLYGDMRYVVNGWETPLYLLLHTADMVASRIIEKDGANE